MFSRSAFSDAWEGNDPPRCTFKEINCRKISRPNTQNRPLCSERRIWERYAELNDIKVRDRFDLDNALHFFRYNHSIRHILTLVYQAGQQEALHESFCRIMTPPDREMDTLSTYREKFYAHGLYGLLDEWIKRDFRETPEEMAETIRQIVPGMGSGV